MILFSSFDKYKFITLQLVTLLLWLFFTTACYAQISVLNGKSFWCSTSEGIDGSGMPYFIKFKKAGGSIVLPASGFADKVNKGFFFSSKSQSKLKGNQCENLQIMTKTSKIEWVRMTDFDLFFFAYGCRFPSTCIAPAEPTYFKVDRTTLEIDIFIDFMHTDGFYRIPPEDDFGRSALGLKPPKGYKKKQLKKCVLVTEEEGMRRVELFEQLSFKKQLDTCTQKTSPVETRKLEDRKF